MLEITLSDCYGHAGLSPDAFNISSRIEPFEQIAANLDRPQVLDAVRFYFGLEVSSDAEWLSGPIRSADESFSMVTNRRELSIISMALIAHEIRQNESQLAALAVLVASSFGRRKPEVYPQFVAMVDAAAKDLMTSGHLALHSAPVRAKSPSKKAGASDEDLVPNNDFASLNRILKEINSESHDLVRDLASQINKAINPFRSQVVRLREETDMLWWLIGGESYALGEPYKDMKEGRAALLVGTDLAGLSRSILGPRASEFLLHKALREGRIEKSEKVKINSLPKLFSQEELAKISPPPEIEKARDLCSFHNLISRVHQVGGATGWQKMYHGDGSLSDKEAFDPKEIAVQIFREACLLDALA